MASTPARAPQRRSSLKWNHLRPVHLGRQQWRPPASDPEYRTRAGTNRAEARPNGRHPMEIIYSSPFNLDAGPSLAGHLFGAGRGTWGLMNHKLN